MLERCEDDWCPVEPLKLFSVYRQGKDDVADVIIHVNEGKAVPLATFFGFRTL